MNSAYVDGVLNFVKNVSETLYRSVLSAYGICFSNLEANSDN